MKHEKELYKTINELAAKVDSLQSDVNRMMQSNTLSTLPHQEVPMTLRNYTDSEASWDKAISMRDFCDSCFDGLDNENMHTLSIDQQYGHNFYGSYFIGMPLDPNADINEDGVAVMFFGDDGPMYVDKQFHGRMAPTSYPIIVGGYNCPTGMYIPFEASKEGIDMVRDIFRKLPPSLKDGN